MKLGKILKFLGEPKKLNSISLTKLIIESIIWLSYEVTIKIITWNCKENFNRRGVFEVKFFKNGSKIDKICSTLKQQWGFTSTIHVHDNDDPKKIFHLM